MTFKQDLSYCLDKTIGANRISKNRLNTIEEKVRSKITSLKNEDLKLFDFSDINQKVESINKIANELSRKYNQIYVLGTGGATLCGQTVCGLQDNKNLKNKVFFVDNIDPKSFEFIKRDITFIDSIVLVISKTGVTLETISQFAFFVDIFENKLGNKFKEHFLVITDTESKNNPIRDIAQKSKIKIIPHEKVGGRFSIYSPVGLIPAAFAELNIKEFLKGAKSQVDKTFIKKDSESITGAALNYLLVEDKKIPATVMMPYVDRLKNFTTWWAQIWAESLGKIDKASTPMRSLGTLDQHSQLQLYLGGKKDKFFNIMYIAENGKEAKIKLHKNFKGKNFDFINNKSFSNIINSAALSTIETLVKNNSLVRVYEIDNLDEFTMGQITMNFILETVLLAKLWNINPFDQPAVEQGKKLTVEKLKKLA